MIKGLNYNPLVSQEVVAAAKKWLEDNRENFKGTANFAILDGDGRIEDRRNGGCHYYISQSATKNRSCVATEIGFNRRADYVGGVYSEHSTLTREEAMPFLKWLLCDSYVAFLFLSGPDDLEFALDYGVVVSADVYTPLMQNALIMTRHFYEKSPVAFRTFNRMTQEMGIHPDLAYNLCFGSSLCSSGNEKTLLDDKAEVTFSVGHTAFGLLNLEAMKNFLARESAGDLLAAINDPKKHYRTYKSYIGGTVLFGRDQVPRYYGKTYAYLNAVFELMTEDKEFMDVMRKHRAKSTATELYRPPNPFAPRIPGETTRTPYGLVYSEYVEVFAPYLNNIFTANKETIYHGTAIAA